jgi:RimJ/RimL family protein N-acetyltransferase
MGRERFLEGEVVFLSEIESSDAALFIRVMDDEEVRVLARSRRDVMNDGNVVKMLENLQRREEGFVVHRRDDGSAIGYALILDRDEYNREASLAISIAGEENRAKGFGRDAMRLLLKHAFIDLNLESVYLSAYEYNRRALGLYESMGFKPVGRRRHSRIIGNKIYDEIILDMIAAEYFSLYGDAEMEKYKL